MRVARIFFLGFLLLSAPHALAQNAPIPPNKQKEIGALDEKLKAQAAQKNALEVELKKQESTLAETKKNLINTAKTVQSSERRLLDLDAKISDLQARQSDIAQKISADQNSIANLVMALSRLRRMPPEAMIARPGAPIQAAQSAMLLKNILPPLQQQAHRLKENLADLERTADELKNQREIAAKESHDLVREQENLTKLVEKRTALYADTHEDYKEQSQKVAQISAQSKNLADLVRKLEQERIAQRKKQQDTSNSKKIEEFAPRMGSAHLPVAGVVITGFHEPDNFGAPSQGIDIEGRSGSIVIAPMGGIIRFAGFFKNYGNMVIVEHQQGWHSLIAGFEKIDTVVGQSVNSGEPLGLLHKSSNGEKPVLYYELRQNGKAVNPAKKIANLS